MTTVDTPPQSAASPGPQADASAPAMPTPSGAEKRMARRVRTSLRSGKIYDLRKNFVVDCQVRDRSIGGLRLRLLGDVPLQTRFKFYDDREGGFADVELRWREDRDIGVKFIAESN